MFEEIAIEHMGVLGRLSMDELCRLSLRVSELPSSDWPEELRKLKRSAYRPLCLYIRYLLGVRIVNMTATVYAKQVPDEIVVAVTGHRNGACLEVPDEMIV